MIEALRAVLERDPRIAYALEARPTVRDLGEMASRLEAASGKAMDLVLRHEAPPALAFRVFAGGRVILERDHGALVARKAQAIIDYLDFKPIEDLCARGVVAATRGR